jgi:predicted DCC family thiol-disulfide oxidoreductase YuxK
MKSLDSENRISFIPITKATSINNTCPIDKKTLLARFHAQEEGQDIVDGAAAFAAMWRQIPRLRWLGNAARNGVVLWVLERVYRGFLVVRPGLQWVLRRVEG